MLTECGTTLSTCWSLAVVHECTPPSTTFWALGRDLESQQELFSRLGRDAQSFAMGGLADCLRINLPTLRRGMRSPPPGQWGEGGGGGFSTKH